MKQKKILTRLILNKETIVDLDPARMVEVVGGTGGTTITEETVADCDPKKPSTPCN